MRVSVDFGGLRGTRWQQYAVRFALGGLVTLATGWIAEQFGPVLGGLFLAFPAIFCASATLIEKHEREKKERKGLAGKERGRNAAALDAVGAGLGSAALAAFGAVIWLLATETAVGSLALATLIWFAVAVLLWRVRRQLRAVRT